MKTKKTLIALAMLGSFAGAASAQSSVTMFGVIDLSMRYVNNDASTYQLAQDGMAASRWGFRGVEDLGGGLKASFWLEGAIGPDTGRGGQSFGNGTTTDALLFTRRATVSLANQWGEVRLGRDYTPTFWNIGVFDPFGVQGVGSSGNLFLSAEVRSLAGAGAAYGTLVRANNTVQYILPNGIFGPGLYGQVMVAAGENAPANKYFGGRIGYAAGPFDVAVAYGDTDVDTAGNVTLTNWNLGGSWNFGVAKLSAFYGSIDLDGLAAGNVKQDNWFIGVTAPIGQWNVKASYGQVKQGGVLDGNKANQFAVGADYNLSRRTALYATYGSISNTNTAYTVSATGSALTRGNNSNGAELGIRHMF
ncbi:MAG: porin [Burkholderiaceae bacterium]